MPALHDDDLLARVAQGDEHALGDLYDHYGRLIYSIALRITGDRQSAEEVTQDVFQSVWDRVTTFDPAAGTVGGWMIGIARHRAIDETRSRRYRARGRELSTDEVAEAQLDDEGSVEQQAVLRSDVRSALAGLPAAQRHALELAYYGGMTCNEIATSLGAPVGTIKTRLRLGLLRLRAILFPQAELVELGLTRSLPPD